MRMEMSRGLTHQWDELQMLLHQWGSGLCFGILSSVLYHIHCIQLGKLFFNSGFFPPEYVQPWNLQQNQAHCSRLCVSFIVCSCISLPLAGRREARPLGCSPCRCRCWGGSWDFRLQHYSFGGPGWGQDWTSLAWSALETRFLAFLHSWKRSCLFSPLPSFLFLFSFCLGEEKNLWGSFNISHACFRVCSIKVLANAAASQLVFKGVRRSHGHGHCGMRKLGCGAGHFCHLLVGLSCGPQREAFPFSSDGIRNVKQDYKIVRTREKESMIQKCEDKERRLCVPPGKQSGERRWFTRSQWAVTQQNWVFRYFSADQRELFPSRNNRRFFFPTCAFQSSWWLACNDPRYSFLKFNWGSLLFQDLQETSQLYHIESCSFWHCYFHLLLEIFFFFFL